MGAAAEAGAQTDRRGVADKHHDAATPQAQAAKRADEARHAAAIEKKAEAERARQREKASDERDQSNALAATESAKAATTQASLATKQTWIGALGLIALIGTLIYQAKGTRAAGRSVDLLVAVERGRISTIQKLDTFTTDGIEITFTFTVRNPGNSEIIIVSYVMEELPSKNYSDLPNVTPTATQVSLGSTVSTVIESRSFPFTPSRPQFFGGSVTYVDVFRDKPRTEYYCFMTLPENGTAGNIVESNYCIGPDWPDYERTSPADMSWIGRFKSWLKEFPV